MEWIKLFIKNHGDRLAFMGLATIYTTVLYIFIPSMREQLGVIYIGLTMLCFNKARGKTPNNEGDN